jgi:hypothetical protein
VAPLPPPSESYAYAGIGSRMAPYAVQTQCSDLAQALSEIGWTLRSGGAKGADVAFEAPLLDTQKEIFLPWPGFSSLHRKAASTDKLIAENPQFVRCLEITRAHHPTPSKLGENSMLLHSRNACQVMGWDLSPASYSKFVVCWTSDGKASGGTGQAIRIAKALNIPVVNLFFYPTATTEELLKAIEEVL